MKCIKIIYCIFSIVLILSFINCQGIGPVNFDLENKSGKNLKIRFLEYTNESSFNVLPNQTVTSRQFGKLSFIEIEFLNGNCKFIYKVDGVFYDTYSYIRSDGTLCVFYKTYWNSISRGVEYREIYPEKVDLNCMLESPFYYYDKHIDELIQKHGIQSDSPYFIN